LRWIYREDFSKSKLVDEANPNQPNKPKKSLQIFAKQSGTTSITLKDAEGTQATVTVNVVGNIS